MEHATGSVRRDVVAALPVALALPFVAGVAWLSGAVVNTPRYSSAATFTVLVGATLVGFIALTREKLPRAGAVAAAGALAWVVIVGGGVAANADHVIVPGLPDRIFCGTGRQAAMMATIQVGAVVACIVGLALTGAAASRKVDPLLRAGATVSIALALIAVAFSIPTWKRPEADTYLASLVNAGEIGEGESKTLAGLALSYQRVDARETDPAPSMRGDEDVMAGPPRVICRLHGVAGFDLSGDSPKPCARLRLRRDPAGDIAVVDMALDPLAPPAAPSWAFAPIAAFRTDDGSAFTIRPSTIGHRLATPLGWRVGAIAGAAFGAVLLFLGRRARRRAAGIAGIEAIHRGDGCVALEGEDRVLSVALAATLPVGPIVLEGVLEGEADKAPGYRVADAPTFRSARAGTLARLREACRDRAVSLEISAFAVALVGATPLLVARFIYG